MHHHPKPKCDQDRIPVPYGTTTTCTTTTTTGTRKPLIDPLITTTAFAALAAVATRWLPVDQPGGLASEAICWGFLAVLLGKRGITRNGWKGQGVMPSPAAAAGSAVGVSKRRKGAVWMVAAAVAGVGWYHAEGGEVWVLVRPVHPSLISHRPVASSLTRACAAGAHPAGAFRRAQAAA